LCFTYLSVIQNRTSLSFFHSMPIWGLSCCLGEICYIVNCSASVTPLSHILISWQCCACTCVCWVELSLVSYSSLSHSSTLPKSAISKRWILISNGTSHLLCYKHARRVFAWFECDAFQLVEWQVYTYSSECYTNLCHKTFWIWNVQILMFANFKKFSTNIKVKNAYTLYINYKQYERQWLHIAILLDNYDTEWILISLCLISTECETEA